jgi:predicted Zn-dependent peptidase
MEDTPKIYSYDNGMQILSLQDDNSNSISIYFYIKVGSKDEPPHLNGISHFIEHMVWKGTPTFKNPLAITRYLDSLGASYNAFVNKYLTAYHYKFPCNLESLDKICKINKEMLFQAIMREKDMNIERNVILEEIKSDLNDPDKYFDDQLEKKIFKEHPLGLVVGGEIDIIKKIKREDLVKYYQEKYIKDNIFIAIVGKLPSGYLKTITKYFLSPKDKKIPNSVKNINIRPFELQLNNKNITITSASEKIPQKHLAICVFTPGLYGNKRLHHKLIAAILAGSMASRLFIKMRDELGLVYQISTDTINYHELGYFIIQSKMKPQNIKPATKAIMEEIEKIKKTGFTQKELTITQNYIISNLIMDMEDTEFKTEFYAEQLFNYSKIKTLKQFKTEINSLTLSQINKEFKNLFAKDIYTFHT